MATVSARNAVRATIAAGCFAVAGIAVLRDGRAVQTAGGPTKADSQGVAPADQNLNIDYDLDPKQERFVDVIPKSYNGKPGWGLVVYIDSQDACPALPAGWEAVLARRKLLGVIPQKAGNEQPVDRRLGLAVLAAQEVMAAHKVDPKRVYAAGLSGGARIAGMLGFYDPAMFKGTIQSCGADFYQKVPKVAKRGPDDSPEQNYGLIHCTDEEIAAGKAGTRFVFITGTHDFRHAQILDIFHGGYEKAGFNARLIDVPGMLHEPCDARQLSSAIDFIEKPPVTTRPTTSPAKR
jgi:hypothetical protein